MEKTEAELTYSEILELARKPVAIDFSPGDEYDSDKIFFQGITSLERTPCGRLWATWFAGGQGESPLNYVVLVTSADDGKSWSKPVFVIDPPGKVRTCDSNIWLDPEGKLWFFWTQGHTLHDGQWGVWAVTTDDLENEKAAWSEPFRICDGVMLNKPAVLKNGEWLFPVSLAVSKMLGNEKRMLPQFLRTGIPALISQHDIEKIDSMAGAYVYSSVDGGKTFSSKGRAISSEDFATHNEHMVVEKKDGSLWMLIRTSYGIGQSFSNDGGVTWSEVVPSGIPHTASRFFVRRLNSGNILLVKNCGMDEKDAQGNPVKFDRTRMTAFLSDDEGHSWKGGLVIEPESSTYPDGTQSSDGAIYIIYDHGRRNEKEILMAKFYEEDILAGKIMSEKSRLRILVNKGTGVIPEEQNWEHFKGRDNPDEKLIFTGI